jgi:hypothetical protein
MAGQTTKSTGYDRATGEYIFGVVEFPITETEWPRTAWKIDALVYELYGLTEEEGKCI